MNWKIGYEKYRTNYASINIRSFVTLSLHYPIFVLLLLCLYAYLVLYYPVFCFSTLSLHYPVFVLLLLCLYAYLVLYYPVFCSSTLSLHYPILFFCYFVFMLILSYIILYSVLLLLCLFIILLCLFIIMVNKKR